MNAVQLSVNWSTNEWAAERKHWFNLYENDHGRRDEDERRKKGGEETVPVTKQWIIHFDNCIKHRPSNVRKLSYLMSKMCKRLHTFWSLPLAIENVRCSTIIAFGCIWNLWIIYVIHLNAAAPQLYRFSVENVSFEMFHLPRFTLFIIDLNSFAFFCFCSQPIPSIHPCKRVHFVFYRQLVELVVVRNLVNSLYSTIFTAKWAMTFFGVINCEIAR